MPLLDHFHSPLLTQRSWESFHSRWANSIADYLQKILPPRYFAEVQIHLGSHVEADVAEVTVWVHDEMDGTALDAVVELVSPRNKDRDESRRAFAAKCAGYLQRGAGLVVADIVTVRHFNLHDDLMRLLGLGLEFTMGADVFLYATAYRPLRREETNQIECWPTPLSVGGTLPVSPLALRGGPILPLDLEATYTDARQRSRF